ncbi:MAG TPA: hypothetical protein VNG33_06895 [Polyangiaceae bacterium]|nr:hypothetical protein [Polyangiaceae bacterium]
MTRFAALLGLGVALGCGRANLAIGKYKPELGQAGENPGPGGSGGAGALGPASTAAGVGGGAGAGAAAKGAGAANGAGATSGTGAAGQPALPEAGTPLDLSKPWQSSGCGLPLPAKQVSTIPGTSTGFTPWSVRQAGETLADSQPQLANSRQFSVRVPFDYDPNRPYRVVYLTRRGCSLGVSNTSTYPLYDEAQGGNEQAVYVDVAVAEEDMNPHCYDTGSGLESMEYEAFDLIHGFVESHYCVDNNRIFVAGSSQGGALANMWGCYFAGIPDPPRKFSPKWAIRGHAVEGGWREANQPLPCNGPSAGIWIQEKDDLESGMYGGSNPSALQLGLSSNGCNGDFDNGPKQQWEQGPSLPGMPGFGGSACMLYTGCTARSQTDFPLVFCSVDGNGATDRAELAVPAFTGFFQSLDPAP